MGWPHCLIKISITWAGKSSHAPNRILSHYSLVSETFLESATASIKEYSQYFTPEDVPGALVKLIEFADTQSGWFSQGFELECDAEDLMFKSYSERSEFLDSLFAIGHADGTGSTYAIWRESGALDDAPVVAFGSEGGAHVVASNLLGLFRILTLDAEPMTSWDEVTYYKPDDAEPSEGAADYSDWLARNFRVGPLRDAKEATQIVKDAQKAKEKKFQEWLKQFAG